MEVKLNTIQAVIAPDNFASLEGMTDTVYRYRFSLSVSKSAAQSVNASNLIVRTYSQDPKGAVSISVFKQPANTTLTVLNLNGRQLINNIKMRSFAATTDIISTRAASLTKNSYSFADLIKKHDNGVGYTLISPNVMKEAINNVVYNVANTLSQESLNEDRTISQLSMEILHQNKTDPANAIQRIFSTRTAYESNNGAASEFVNIATGKNEQKIIGSLLSSNVDDNNPDPIIQTYKVAERDRITIHFDADLPIAAMDNSNFYVMFSITDVDNSLVQEFVKYVQHKNNLGLLERVQLPPTMSIVKGSGGHLTISLQQNDPHAVGVKLYKIIYNGTGNNGAAIQQFAGNYDVDFGKVRSIDVQNNDVGLVLFRALSYSAGGGVSSDFTSDIVEIYPNDIGGQSKKDAFVILRGEYANGGYNISVSELPDDVVFAKLYRADITQDLYATAEILTTFMVGGVGALSSYAYLDDSVDDYRKYQYHCELVDIKGQEYPASGVLEVYYRPQTQSYATITISNPLVAPVQYPGNATQYFDVSFTIDVAITPKLEDDVRSLLASQGLSEFYGSDINRDNLRELVVSKVELRNLHTNDVFFMGFVDRTFSQSATTYGLLRDASSYVYTITSYVRSPSTLLRAVSKKANSNSRPNGTISPPTYVYSPFNLNHPYGLLTGTNPKASGDEFVSQYGIDQLAFGGITAINDVLVDLKPPIPVINNLKAFGFNSKIIELVWSVNGSQDEISHFIIRRENIQTGKLDLVGRAHGINVQNSFSYLDPIRYTETGIFRYIITMQYTDLSLSQDYVSNEVVI